MCECTCDSGFSVAADMKRFSCNIDNLIDLDETYLADVFIDWSIQSNVGKTSFVKIKLSILRKLNHRFVAIHLS